MKDRHDKITAVLIILVLILIAAFFVEREFEAVGGYS
jgi:hypothetical protein